MSDSPHPYGPNTPAIRAFLVRFAGLGASDRHAVVSRYASASGARAYHAAESLLATAIERSGREPLQQALSGPLLQLVRRTESSALSPDNGDTDAVDQLDPVAEPALAALLALLVRDLLEPAHFAQLYGSFSEVVPLSDLPG